MFALDLLRVPLARLVLVGIEMPCICASIVGVIARDTKRLEQRFALQKHLILPPATDIRQHLIYCSFVQYTSKIFYWGEEGNMR